MEILYHGSEKIIEKPIFGSGNTHNDYGLGFYCTQNSELAKEWACKTQNGGYANKYSIDTSSLAILNLSDSKYTILNWIALLLNNRIFSTNSPIATDGKRYLIENFMPKTKDFDVIIGYRADDSYFSFAQDFLNNTISIKQLNRAMKLGNLGEQFVLISKKAFDLLSFENYEIADGKSYFSQREKRDMQAREAYLKHERNLVNKDDIFLIDILRKELKQDDESLQRILS